MSTSEPIKISYIWNRENFLKAFEKSYRYQYKNSIRRYIGWFFIVMAQFGIIGMLKGGSFGMLMLFSILLFYWYIAKKWLIKRRDLKEFEKSPLKDKEIDLKITQDGIHEGDIFIDWDKIDGVVPMEDDILLYYEDKDFYIPSSAFKSIEDKSRLKELAKQKGKLFK